MSHPANDKLYDEFMDTLESITICPYCGWEVETEPHMGCCGEVHSELAWLQEGGDPITEGELQSAFEEWKKTRVPA